MTKNLLSALLASAFAISASAHAAGAYIGTNIGSVEHRLPVGDGSDKEHKAGVKLYGGYSFNENFGVEGGYVHMGKVSNSDTDGINTVSASYRARALYIAGTATMPLSQQFSLFAKAGVTANRGRVTARFNGNSDTVSRSHTAAMFGVGAEYNFAKNMSAVAEYENFGKVINVDDRSTKAQMLSVGLRYKF